MLTWERYHVVAFELLEDDFDRTDEGVVTTRCANCGTELQTEVFVKAQGQPTQQVRAFVACDHCGRVDEVAQDATP